MVDGSCEPGSTSAVARITNGPLDGSSVGVDDNEFEFASDDPLAEFECAIDSGSFASCSSPFMTGALSDDQYEFKVRAVDSLGAPISDISSRVFTVDTLTPSLDVADGPENQDVTSRTSPAWSLESDDPTSHFVCSVDGGDAETCQTPFAPRLGVGGHSVSFRAVDAAGNESDVDERTIFVVDAASVDVSSGPQEGEPFEDSVAEFEFGSEDAVSFECAEDGGPYVACTSPYEFESDYSGDRAFAVRGLDGEGSPGAPEVRVISFANGPPFEDRARPVTQLDLAPADGATVFKDPVIEFSSSEPGTFKCRVDSADWETCESPLDLTEHEPSSEVLVEVAAVDLAGNFTAEPASVRFAYQPESMPANVAATVDVLTNVFPEALAEAPSITLPSEEELSPSLDPVTDEEDGDPGNESVSTGTMVSTSVGYDPLDGFAVDSTAGQLSFAIDEASPKTSPGAQLSDISTASSDVGEDADIVVRPNVGGVDISTLVRSSDGSGEVVWEVGLEPDQHLEELPDGSVAVVGLARDEGATEEDAMVPSVNPSEVTGEGAADYEAQVDAIDSAGDETDDAAIAVLTAPSAVDANSDPVDVNLSVGADGRTVKLSVNPEHDPVSAPVMAAMRTSSDQISTKATMRTVSARHAGLAGGHPDAFTPWPGFDGSPSRGDMMLDRLKALGGGDTVPTLRILVPWDAADSQGSCGSGAPTVDGSSGENPYPVISRCWHLWKTENEMKSAWDATGGNMRFYISPDQAPYSANHDSPGTYGVACRKGDPPTTRHQIPCTAGQFKASFSLLYTTLQSFAATHLGGTKIHYWSAFNEPDLLLNPTKTTAYGPRPKGVTAAFAAGTYATVAKKVEGDASCGQCRVFAGEFASPIWRDNPQSRSRQYAYQYLKEIVRRVNKTKKLKSPDRLRPPGMWSFHAYSDISNAGGAVKPLYPNEHGTGPFKSVKYIYKLIHSQKALRNAKAWMTEGAVRLDVPSAPAVNQNTAQSRDINVPRAVRRFLYLLKAGKKGYKNDGKDNGDLPEYFKGVRGALYYQLTSTEDGFDSNLFEGPNQRLQCNWSADDRDGCSAGVPDYPRPRPAWCALMGQPTTLCKGDNRRSKEYSPAASTPATAAGSLRIRSSKRANGGYVGDAFARTTLSINPEIDTVDFDYKASISLELCYVYTGSEEEVWLEDLTVVKRGEHFQCQDAPLCKDYQCTEPGGSSRLTFDVPANEDFDSVVPATVERNVFVKDHVPGCEVYPGMHFVLTPKLTLYTAAPADLIIRDRNVDPEDDAAVEDYSAEDSGTEYVGQSDVGSVEGFWCS